jgi:hypothetical protein
MYLCKTRRVIKLYEVTNKGEGELLPASVKFLEVEGKCSVLLVSQLGCKEEEGDYC